MTVREIRNLCAPSLVVTIYPLGLYGTGHVYFRGLVADIPEILFEEEVLSIMPFSRFEQGISIEYDEHIMKETSK